MWRFDRYRLRLRAIHRPLMKDVCDKHAISYRRARMSIEHLSVRQYARLQLGHAYTYLVCEIRLRQSDSREERVAGIMAVGINARYKACLYQHKYIQGLIASSLVSSWNSIARMCLGPVSESETCPYKADETIEAVRFECDRERLFEILYPTTMVTSVFELVSARRRRRVRPARATSRHQ